MPMFGNQVYCHCFVKKDFSSVFTVYIEILPQGAAHWPLLILICFIILTNSLGELNIFSLSNSNSLLR